jgi:phage baseplate assembly protein W
MSFYRRKREVVNTVVPTLKYAKPIGITIPFNNPNGIFNQSFTNVRQVLSNLKNLLLTARGERYMLPTFGPDIRTVLFENITSEEDFTTRLNGEIESAIQEWMPYLIIQELETIIPSELEQVVEKQHSVEVKLSVKISGTNIYLPIQIFIDDTGNLEIKSSINT